MRADRPAIVPVASVFCIGLLAQTAQILVARELLILVEGNEYVIGFLLAAWLLWGAAGARVAAFIVRACRGNGARCGATTMDAYGSWSLWLAAVALQPCLVVTRLARPIFAAPPGTPLPLADTMLASLLAPSIPCLALGAAFAFFAADRKRLTSGAGFGIESLGALVAGCCFAMVSVRILPPLANASLMTLLTMCIISPALVAHSSQTGTQRRTLRSLPTLIVVLLTGGISLAELWRPALPDQIIEKARWASLLPGYELLEVAETPYGRYTALAREGQVSIFHDGKPFETLPDPEAGMVLAHTALLQLEAPDSVLVIASATHPIAAHILEHMHGSGHVDCVEQDTQYGRWRAAIQRVAKVDASALVDSRMQTYAADPGRFLAQRPGQYDAVIIDLPDPSTIGLDRYYQRHFIQNAFDALTHGGVLCLSVSGEANYLSEPILDRNALVYATVRSVFGSSVLASNGDPTIMLARKSEVASSVSLTYSPEVLAARLRALPRATCLPYLAFVLDDPWPAARVQTINNELAGCSNEPAEPSLTHDDLSMAPLAEHAPINIRTRPAAYQANLMAVTAKYDPKAVPFVRALPRLAAWIVAILWLALLIGTTVRRRFVATGTRAGSAAPACAALVAAGFVAMGLQMINLIWYQHCCGSLYVDLAILSAAYMAGVAVGSLTAARYLPRSRTAAARFAMVGTLSLAANAAILWGAMAIAESGQPVRATCLALSLLGGAALGMHFTAWDHALAPAASRQECDFSTALSGGTAYAADLLGAAIAGCLMAAIVISAYGYTGALCCCAAFLIIMCAAIVACPRSDERPPL